MHSLCEGQEQMHQAPRKRRLREVSDRIIVRWIARQIDLQNAQETRRLI